ncbi:MAG: molybdopterin-dependent oxidoreductase [Burkholderiales bacterium]|nr:molybdopterin-dependent oxidoreductase [Burkholderiales bacterium]
MSFIGKSVPAQDWEDRTSGRTLYASDLHPEGMLFGMILRSPYPYARIEGIDTSAALRIPGVCAVVTSKDLPPNTRYFHEGAADRPPLAEDLVRFVGQEVAGVAAETRAAAAEALAAIRVSYTPMQAPLDPAQAVLPGAAQLHARAAAKQSDTPNLSRRIERRWGAISEALSRSNATVGGRFSYPRVTHACMEPHVTLASWDAKLERMHLWTSTQAPFFIVKEVALALGLERAQVVCHEVAVGGGFGVKSKICEHEVIAALLARASGRPVRIALNREEEFAFTKPRHRFDMDLELHASQQGDLLGISGNIVVDNGAYDHSGVSVVSAGLKAFGMMYRPIGIDVKADLVDTATHPSGQFRGYGSTQTGFAMECLVDEVAQRLGQDPVDIRMLNANRAGERTLIGAELGSVRLDECLRVAAQAISWKQRKGKLQAGQGIGIAAAVHPSGAYAIPDANRSDAAIDIHRDGKVCVRFGGADAGTGQRTILAQIAATELGVPLDSVEVVTMDSDRTPFDMGAWSSRGTHFSGHAVKLAASVAAQRLKDLETGALDGVMSVECSFVDTRVERNDPLTGVGNYSGSYNFAAHAVWVDVDRRTGQIKLLDYVAAHDVGKALNPVAVEGQIMGGAAMGIGAALAEELIYEQGKLVNGAFLHYALPRAADLPRIRPFIVDSHDPNGPYGAKAVGETGVNPPGGAISNAVYDAIGVRIGDLPITPDKVLNALAEKEGRTRDFQLWRRPGRWWIGLVRWSYPRGLFKLLHQRIGPLATPACEPPPASLAQPETIAEALEQSGAGSMPVAGGTDVQLQRRQGIAAPVKLVSLMNIDQMRGIDLSDERHVAIGAAVTLADVVRELGQMFPVLAEAIGTIASSQIREMATVGGNLLQGKRCWFFRNDFPCYKRKGGLAPCYAINGDHRFYHAVIDGHRCQAVTPSDLATVLVALDAQAIIAGRHSRRSLPVQQLYSGPGESVLQEDELLTGIRIPRSAQGASAVFEKLRLWEGDFAVVSAAVAVEREPGTDPGVGDVRIVLGALAPVPWRACGLERHLAGLRAMPAASEVRRLLDEEFNRCAHPLPRNGWKLDAASGIVERLFERIASSQ